jgi:hypothetical protein
VALAMLSGNYAYPPIFYYEDLSIVLFSQSPPGEGLFPTGGFMQDPFLSCGFLVENGAQGSLDFAGGLSMKNPNFLE